MMLNKVNSEDTMNAQTRAFVRKVARINESIYTVRALMDTLIEDLEAGRVVLEEFKVDKGTYRDSIRLSVWKEGEHAPRT